MPDLSKAPALFDVESYIQNIEWPEDAAPHLKIFIADNIRMFSTNVMKMLLEKNELEIALLKDEMRRTNDVAMKEAIAEYQKQLAKERKPLTKEEIQQLLDQEYATFTVKLFVDDENGGKTHEFTLRELPEKQEEKFFKMLKDSVVRLTQELGAQSFKMSDGNVADKIMSVMEVFEPTFDLLAEACVICLNPKGKIDWLTQEWVKENIATHRIYAIVQAQAEVNKLRDFFSKVFQGWTSTQTSNPVDSQL